MSRKGNCLDNAPIESFFGHLKDEVDLKSCQSFDELKIKVENYIYYYNNERCQWSLNKMTPAQRRCHLLFYCPIFGGQINHKGACFYFNGAGNGIGSF